MTPQEEIAPLGDVPVESKSNSTGGHDDARGVAPGRRQRDRNTSRSAGENIDIYIGGVLCGSGEIVVIENTLGVRITDFRDD